MKNHTTKKPYYILWVWGIDDTFDTIEEAEASKKEWEDKGYDDVQIETVYNV